MERTEPTFVPEWLKSSGSLTTTSSSLHSDDQGASKSARFKSLDNDRTTSSYFRRTSSNNGSHLRSYGSFNRNHNRDWDKDIYKEKSENRYHDRDYSDPLANILPNRFEKDKLRRSHSNLSTKRGESLPKKVIVSDKNGHNNNFEREFPTLDKISDCEMGRVASHGLSNVIQSLPLGNVAVIGGDGWTSALAEVPVMVGSNGSNVCGQQPSQTGRNMAETLAHGPPRVNTAPQLSVGTQRLEELAVKQSRQLIPVTPSMPKALAMNSSDKPKLKVNQLHLQNSHIVNHSPSPRPVSTKLDTPKTSNLGKLHVLKPSRERNGTIPTPTSKETLSPTGVTKLPNCPHPQPLILGTTPSRNTSSIEKKPSPQAQSRNDFFNLMRKKSMANSTTTAVVVDHNSSESTNGGTHLSGENKVEKFNENNNEKNNSSKVILYSEEEEARFLKSLGWEETTEEEGLTEEEINSFYRDVSKYVNLKTASNFFKGTQPKCLMTLNLQMGKNADISPNTKVDS